jgi:GAF domain-containing protein
MPFYLEHGERFPVEPFSLGVGLTGEVFRTREPLVVNENLQARAAQLGAKQVGDPATANLAKSYLGVPILKGDDAFGVIGLYGERDNAFSESDVRLLQTLANAMSVALENARLFDETQRLLKETEQRAAELAIINSVQQALAAELNMQGIYDAVGDKIREIFQQADIGIRIYDPQTDLISYPYRCERGQRIVIEPHTLRNKGFAGHVLRTRETLVIQENMVQEAARYGSFILPGAQLEKSVIFVPLVAGDHARGLINLIDMEREHAFSDSDVRLLQTLANAMSVALENARLFDETQRRTRETAALAEVGRDISSTLDLATVMDRIARHAKDLLNAGSSAIFLPDASGQTYRAIVAVGDVAGAIQSTVIESGAGIIGSLVQSGRAEFINDTGADPRAIQIPGTEKKEDERLMVAPLMAAQTVKGAMAVWRTEGQPFLDSELEFWSMSADDGRHRERAPVRRSDSAPPSSQPSTRCVAAASPESSTSRPSLDLSATEFAGVQCRHRLRRVYNPHTGITIRRHRLIGDLCGQALSSTTGDRSSRPVGQQALSVIPSA